MSNIQEIKISEIVNRFNTGACMQEDVTHHYGYDLTAIHFVALLDALAASLIHYNGISPTEWRNRLLNTEKQDKQMTVEIIHGRFLSINADCGWTIFQVDYPKLLVVSRGRF